jgi:hypothetical protein
MSTWVARGGKKRIVDVTQRSLLAVDAWAIEEGVEHFRQEATFNHSRPSQL